eukprot:TRINITY_DN10300_c0_g1_i2.p1 TRINITY_DN10300_c0_g1~~TRINITY_DN10300_c0_g1_i2.p1  ORF type:complete len:829 (-),score=208.05 TRINITY_DN10300_c0_g1_i2:66-2552(-)
MVRPSQQSEVARGNGRRPLQQRHLLPGGSAPREFKLSLFDGAQQMGGSSPSRRHAPVAPEMLASTRDESRALLEFVSLGDGQTDFEAVTLHSSTASGSSEGDGQGQRLSQAAALAMATHAAAEAATGCVGEQALSLGEALAALSRDSGGGSAPDTSCAGRVCLERGAVIEDLHGQRSGGTRLRQRSAAVASGHSLPRSASTCSTDTGRSAPQVLAKSRQLFWQRIERDVQEAFEAVVEPPASQASAGVLLFEQLDNFLVRLHCLPSPERRRGPDQEANAVRLCQALWRWLDPERLRHSRQGAAPGVGKTGVDLLTLTVFFHVLLAEAPSLQQHAGNSGASSCASLPQAQGIGSAVGEQTLLVPSPSLGAISEEQVAAAAAVVSVEDDYERRIAEILASLEPLARLRSDFKELYCQRMFFLATEQAAMKTAAGQPQAHIRGRELSPRSAELASRWEERLWFRRSVLLAHHSAAASETESTPEGEQLSVDLNASRDDLLEQWRMEAEARKEILRAHLDAEEVRECTFQPQLLARQRSRSPEGASSTRSPPRHEGLYQQALTQRQCRVAKDEMVSRRKDAEELEECTFRPDTAKSARSYYKTAGAPAQYPRGFHECRQRLRHGNACRAEAERMRNDRLGRLKSPERSVKDGSTETLPSRSHSSFSSSEVSKLLKLSALDAPYGAADGRTLFSPDLASPLAAVVEEGEEPVDLSADAGCNNRRSSSVSTTARQQALRLQAPPPRPILGSRDVLPTSAADKGNVVLNVEVRVRPSSPPRVLEMREGETTAEAAADFAARHALPPQMAQKLYEMLDQEYRTHVASWMASRTEAM